MGCDVPVVEMRFTPILFQLTHPMRGATKDVSFLNVSISFQLTHPIRGATSNVSRKTNAFFVISTHTPHAGCDSAASRREGLTKQFQLTHPMWGATRIPQSPGKEHNYFNSHTPGGVRQAVSYALSPFRYFNSHTPCGVRPIVRL